MTTAKETLPRDTVVLASELPTPADPYLTVRVHRATLTTFVVSLIVHLLVLFVVPKPETTTGEDAGSPLGSADTPMQVRIAGQATAPTSEIIPAPADTPRPASKRNKSRRDRPTILTAPTASTPTTPSVPTPVPTDATDLDSFVKAAQARRRAAQGLPPIEAAEAPPSEDAQRMAQVMRNLRSGTNGLFQLMSMNPRSAAFSFRGWTTDINAARREYINVEIGTNPTIEMAVVRKMIEIIRRHYKGNFNWESQRLDRVVTLSAKPEDSEGLEEFLMKEFFAYPGRR